MTELEILIKQTHSAYDWTHRLMDSVPTDKWDTLPETLGANFSWQIGHLVVSIYYHTIMTTVGHMPELIEKLDLRTYTKLCGYDTHAQEMIGNWSPEQLSADLRTMQEKSLKVINTLTVVNLWESLEPLKVSHPVAKTKFEAIDWNVKHTMWHCGQMATIKRLVDEPYDYGLAKRG